MTTSPRNSFWLIVGIAGLSFLGWLMTTSEPHGVPSLILFLSVVSGTSFSLSLFVVNNTRRAVLISTGITVYFVLRYIGLRHIIYPILLVASLLSLELVSHKR